MNVNRFDRTCIQNHWKHETSACALANCWGTHIGIAEMAQISSVTLVEEETKKLIQTLTGFKVRQPSLTLWFWQIAVLLDRLSPLVKTNICMLDFLIIIFNVDQHSQIIDCCVILWMWVSEWHWRHSDTDTDTSECRDSDSDSDSDKWQVTNWHWHWHWHWHRHRHSDIDKWHGLSDSISDSEPGTWLTMTVTLTLVVNLALILSDSDSDNL